MKKILIISTLIFSLILPLAACDSSDNDGGSSKTNKTKQSKELQELIDNTIQATITLDNGDEINLELYPDLAPETVENFIELADDGFYDGTIFHRVIEDFVIQGGGYDEDLNKLKTSTIDGEFTSNGFVNELSHERGVISMARVSNDPDSASSEFFIVVEDAAYLDGEYAAFGRVADDESMEVVDDISEVRTGTVESAGLNDVPITPVVIESITINSSASDKTSSKKSSSSKSASTPKTSSKENKSNDKDTDEDELDEIDYEEFEEYQRGEDETEFIGVNDSSKSKRQSETS